MSPARTTTKHEKTHVYPMKCAVQKNHWGKVGEQSTVASLARTQKDFDFDENMTYAELWMGAHPKWPSFVNNAGEMCGLAELLQDQTFLIGDKVLKHFGERLPFLFKVLSINMVLSLQAHPDKQRAEVLHKQRPDIYLDSNHKPEIAIAVTPFEALCAFRPVSQILEYLETIKELHTIIGLHTVNNLKKAQSSKKGKAIEDAIKECLTRLLNSTVDEIKTQLYHLVQRVNTAHLNGEDTKDCLGHLLLKIHTSYPGDVGCFTIYFLNYVQLQPDESIYFGPNVPHAYVQGDIIECMANSDNVLRAGLTPNYRDVNTFLDILEYTPMTIEETKFVPTVLPDEPFSLIYNPPIDDFSVKKIKISPFQVKEYDVKPINGPSILLIFTGECCVYASGETGVPLRVSRGSVLFIGCGKGIKLANINEKETLLMFQAYCDMVC